MGLSGVGRPEGGVSEVLGIVRTWKARESCPGVNRARGVGGGEGGRGWEGVGGGRRGRGIERGRGNRVREATCP